VAYPPLPPPPSDPPPVPAGWNASGAPLIPAAPDPVAGGAWTIRAPGRLGVVDTVEVGFSIWSRHWRQLAVLSFALSGWITVVTALVDPGPTFRDVIEAIRTGVVTSELGEPSSLSQALGLLSSFVLLPISIMATARIALGTTVGSSPSNVAAVLYGLRRLPSTWWLYLALFLTLLGVLIPVALLALLLGAAWDPLALSAGIPLAYVGLRITAALIGAFVVDDARGFKAVARSWALTEGRWWPTAGALLLAALLSIAATIVVLVAQLLIPGSGRVAAVVQASLAAGTNAIVGPIAYAVLAAVYLDLRARHVPTLPEQVRALIEHHDPG